MREIYLSSNGDRWLLVSEKEAGTVLVRHIPNVASGGKPTDIHIAAFLSKPSDAPEYRNLITLIASLTEDGAATAMA